MKLRVPIDSAWKNVSNGGKKNQKNITKVADIFRETDDVLIFQNKTVLFYYPNTENTFSLIKWKCDIKKKYNKITSSTHCLNNYFTKHSS